MKLNLLHESFDVLDKMYQYIKNLGLTDNVVDKIFKFAKSGRFHKSRTYTI